MTARPIDAWGNGCVLVCSRCHAVTIGTRKAGGRRCLDVKCKGRLRPSTKEKN